jgi:hypothetical protein
MKVRKFSKRLVLATSLVVLVLGAVVYAVLVPNELANYGVFHSLLPLNVAYAAPSPSPFARGTNPLSLLIGGPAIVTDRKYTLHPGDVTDWHYHPGYAFNVVVSGTLTLEDGCGGEEMLQGTGNPTNIANPAFEELDGRVHRGKNLSMTEDVIVYNTFIVPQERGTTTTVNIPGNIQQCGPPRDVNECKDDGWVKFTWPRTFTDQGDCVQYVRHRPRIILPVPEDPLQ